ncbi:hypothetical protein V5O48_006159 [Marasmius crinis-equi]|uniref:F-box domain-containing protein n=1 Tax=Marasmius crinis-equi TaxID=585013 RepID=A0ABR3FKM6_9AGAR
MAASTGLEGNHTSDTLEYFDEQMKKAREDLQELAYQRNLRVPICCLPVEILGRILILTSTRTGLVWRDILFPKVMHVCRLWRTIAMNTPSIWSQPDFCRPKLALEMIKYGKSAPLDITWGFSSEDSRRQEHLDVLSEALLQVSRISSLVLSCTPSEFTRLVPRMVSPLPSVHSLRLECKDDQSFVVLPEKLLGSDAPHLIHFRAHGCGIPWGSPILGNLTTLSITRFAMPGLVAPSAGEMAAALQAMTGLEELEMLDFFPSHSSIAVAQNAKQVILPRLKSIKLSSSGRAIAVLLRSISFPIATKVDLDIPEPDDAQDLLAECISSLFSETSMAHRRTVRSLSISDGGTGNIFRLLTWNTCGQGPLDPPQFRCRIGRVYVAEPFSLTRKFLDSLGPITSLETLDISTYSLSRDTILQRFGNLPLLGSIHVRIHTRCALDVVYFLSDRLTPSSAALANEAGQWQPPNTPKSKVAEGEQSTSVFPALTTLNLSDMTFNSNLLPALVSSLERRSENGHPLKTLVLEHCRHIYSHNIKAILDRVDIDIQRYPDETHYDDDSSDDSEAEPSHRCGGGCHGEDFYDSSDSDDW